MHYSIFADARSESSGIDSSGGIVSDKDYQVIEAKTYIIEEKDVRLVRLRNTYSKQEWNGKYSRLSPKLSKKDITQFYNYLPAGEFYISFTDYLENFASTSMNVDAEKRAHY